ncbi:MAG: hypothetical protein IT530_12105 [Burkholderiales bacterium]|nr:hypothetical protein [Burkholderiales bacterium]
MLPPEEAAAEAKRWFAAGFRSAKVKVGGGIEADRDRVAAVRAAVGNAMKLRIDANCLYGADTSLKLCAMLRPYDLQLFEQPAPKEDIAGLARVRREGGIPVMADETISDHPSLVAVIKAGAADYVKFAIKQAGGILRATCRLATVEANGIPCVIGHGFGLDPSTVAEIMLAASSRNVLAGLECVGPLKVRDIVTTTRLDISSGSVVQVAPNLVPELLGVARVAQHGIGCKQVDDVSVAEVAANPGALARAARTEEKKRRTRAAECACKHRRQIDRQFGDDASIVLCQRKRGGRGRFERQGRPHASCMQNEAASGAFGAGARTSTPA